MKHDWFEKHISAYALVTKVIDVDKKVAKCALQEKTAALIDRLDAMHAQLNKRVNNDFVTKDQINGQLNVINQKIGLEFVTKPEFRETIGKLRDRMRDVDDLNQQCKKAL